MYLILKIFDLYSFLILLNILGSWIDPYNQISIFQWIRKFTDPYLKMFKIVIPIGNMNLDYDYHYSGYSSRQHHLDNDVNHFLMNIH